MVRRATLVRKWTPTLTCSGIPSWTNNGLTPIKGHKVLLLLKSFVNFVSQESKLLII